MRLDGDRVEARTRNVSGPAEAPPFNDKLVPLLADWIDESMKQPPVASASK
jgi:hypothetical protein